MTTALAKTEKATLAECEAIIERGRDTFVEVGNALLRIREERLYRAEFGTFQEYCEAKWGMSDRHARRLIDAAEVAGNLQNGPTGPLSERQTRPLAALPAPVQREAWKQAVETSKNGRPTAKEVGATVERITDPVSKKVSVKDHDESDNDSDVLFHLKQWWKKATKKDKAAFLKWAQS